MTLLTAHKILISCAVALFVLLTGWEYGSYADGDASALPLAIFSALAAVALAAYLRWVWVHKPGG
jgi:hypothetical protein